MHGTVAAIGPLMWALAGVGLLTWAFALFVAVDGMRRRAGSFVSVPETRWPYVAISAVYVVVFAAYQVPAATAALGWLGSVVLAGLPVSLAVSVAYLLRVVFPKPVPVPADPSPEEIQR